MNKVILGLLAVTALFGVALADFSHCGQQGPYTASIPRGSGGCLRRNAGGATLHQDQLGISWADPQRVFRIGETHSMVSSQASARRPTGGRFPLAASRGDPRSRGALAGSVRRQKRRAWRWRRLARLPRRRPCQSVTGVWRCCWARGGRVIAPGAPRPRAVFGAAHLARWFFFCWLGSRQKKKSRNCRRRAFSRGFSNIGSVSVGFLPV